MHCCLHNSPFLQKHLPNTGRRRTHPAPDRFVYYEKYRFGGNTNREEAMCARRGRDLEILVKYLETELEKIDEGTIESPGFLVDKITKEKREFDVLVRMHSSPDSSVDAFECKDWKGKVDTPVIEGYVTKCADCSVRRKHIVSSKGFTQPAIQKASEHGIQCHTLKQTDISSWVLINSLPVLRKTYISFNYLPNLCSSVNPTTAHKIIDDKGCEVTQKQLIDFFRDATNKYIDRNWECPTEAGRYRVCFRITPEGLWVLDSHTNAKLDISHIELVSDFQIDIEESPIIHKLYHDDSSEETKANVSESAFEINGIRCKLVAYQEPEGGGKISLIQYPPNSKK